MLPENFVFGPISFPVNLLFFVLAVFCSVFLFWRSGRHELYESDFLFDLILVSTVGGLVGGRILAFLTNAGYFTWSLKRLIFFNAYFGFDFFGALLVAGLAIAFSLKWKSIAIFKIFDLFAFALVFGHFIVYLGRFLISTKLVDLFLATFFLSVFFVLKRLATKKRHHGFFACIYFLAVVFFQIISYLFARTNLKILGINYQLVIVFLLLFFATTSWYILASRKPKEDSRRFFAFLLLTFFKAKRVITNLGEADEIAKFIVLAPYYLAKALFYLGRAVFKEFVSGGHDLIGVLGIKNDRR